MEHPLLSDWSKWQLICHLIGLRQLQLHHPVSDQEKWLKRNQHFNILLATEPVRGISTSGDGGANDGPGSLGFFTESDVRFLFFPDIGLVSV